MPGDVVMITDHINLHQHNPLVGANDDDFGPRFIGLEDLYNQTWRDKFHHVAKQENIILHVLVNLIMYKLEENTTDFLKRVNFLLKNEKVHTKCIKNMDVFEIFGEKFGPFEKEKGYKLPFFKVIPFIENNILSIPDRYKCDNVDFQRYVYEERDNNMLIKRESNYFLNKIKEFKSFLEKEVKRGIKPHEFIHNYNSYLLNLVDRRLFKLLKLTRTELNVDEERTLSKSEQFLYEQIFSIIKKWRDFFLT